MEKRTLSSGYHRGGDGPGDCASVAVDQAVGRWQQFMTQHCRTTRAGLANRVALTAIGDAGPLWVWTRAVSGRLSALSNGFEGRLGGSWRFLHDDYLQTILEWGWIGSAVLIAALFFGGHVPERFRITVKRPRDGATRQRIFLPCVAAGAHRRGHPRGRRFPASDFLDPAPGRDLSRDLLGELLADGQNRGQKPRSSLRRLRRAAKSVANNR